MNILRKPEGEDVFCATDFILRKPYHGLKGKSYLKVFCATGPRNLKFGILICEHWIKYWVSAFGIANEEISYLSFKEVNSEIS